MGPPYHGGYTQFLFVLLHILYQKYLGLYLKRSEPTSTEIVRDFITGTVLVLIQ